MLGTLFLVREQCGGRLTKEVVREVDKGRMGGVIAILVLEVRLPDDTCLHVSPGFHAPTLKT